jgi:ribosomal protein S18 acetylase RimI-like enzyme
MDEAIVFRVAKPGDAPELARLNAAFNDVYEPPEATRARLLDPACVETPLIALAGVRAVAFAALRVVPCVFYEGVHAELTELYVEPGWRRQGIARQLIMMAEELALERGAGELHILTGTDNAPALELYRSLGYEDGDISLTKALSTQRRRT